MAKKLTKEQVSEFKEAFALFDKDGDGNITTLELEPIMKFLGQDVSDVDIHGMICDLNTDGNGTIDFFEFLSLVALNIKCQDQKKELFEIFETIDSDRNGLISDEELKFGLANLGIQFNHLELDETIKKNNIDRIKNINFDEFCRMMTLNH